ncbi:MAG: fumarylacetoacetate hydrolase family protein [Erysipelotrichaceae bacterium]|nr:fumarylacetoacetate hydrolase family protein [Erysipelotrichaceae bacterium]
MKLVRYEYDGIIRKGKLVDGFIYPQEEGPTFPLPLEEVILHIPIEPTKIIMVGLNYAKHAKEMGFATQRPEVPIIFIKPNSALQKNGGKIVMPPQSQQVEFEGELGVVISVECKNVQKEAAVDVILGYFIANDVTARDLQPKLGQWTACKAFDTFLPVSSWIETEFDIKSAEITTKLNGEIRQNSPISTMLFSVEELIEYISSIMTLMPGDVIITGSPPGIGKFDEGDIIEVSISGLGSLFNEAQKAL